MNEDCNKITSKGVSHLSKATWGNLVELNLRLKLLIKITIWLGAKGANSSLRHR
jgi:hypothetical protein